MTKEYKTHAFPKLDEVEIRNCLTKTGSEYVPYLSHRNPSKGNISRIPGNTTGRTHVTLSSIETAFLYIFDDDPTIIDIKEQFYLRLEETLQIADDLGYYHPYIRKKDKRKSEYVPMTTDFVLTKKTGELIETIAVQVKHAETLKRAWREFEERKKKSEHPEKLKPPRVFQKIMIEQEYWRRQGVKYILVTDKDYTRERINNIDMYRNVVDYRPEDLPLLYKLREILLTAEVPVIEVLWKFSRANNISKEKADFLLLNLLKFHMLPVDMDRRFDPRKVFKNELCKQNVY